MIYKSYTLRFVLHRRTDTPRQYVQMRVTPRGGRPVSFATGLSLTAGEWDAALGRAKGRTPESAAVNTLIAEWTQVVAGIFSHYDSLNIVPAADQLRQAFARATETAATAPVYVPQAEGQTTVLAAFTQFMIDRQAENSWSKGTLQILSSFRRMLSVFKPDTPLAAVDEAWVKALHRWMVDVRQLQGVTVDGNLVKIRWFLRWARRKGLYKGTADQDYRPRVMGAGERSRAIVYLTRDELRQFEAHRFDEPHYQVAQDVFLFGCYTGLRSSDIIKLSQADIHDGHITLTTQKTSHTITIPLNEKARRILDKYAGCRPGRRQKYTGNSRPALPAPFHKTLNKHLHKMMQLAGIDAPTHHVYFVGNDRHDDVVPKYDLVTTHTARHTFIVLAIGLGVPVPVIMEWTGHSDYKAMRPYIAIANDTSVQAMHVFDTL